MIGVMIAHAHSRRLVLPILFASMSIASVSFGQTAAAAKPQNKGVVIRGCLTGSKLTHVEPDDASLNVPDVLKVSSLRVIRNQVKALDGHQVELIGSLRLPGQDRSVLVADTDKAKLYVGGGDKNLGEDFGVDRAEPATMYVRTIKDLSTGCTGAPPAPAPPAK